MGLLGTVLTAPLAPVRLLGWVAGVVAAQAEQEVEQQTPSLHERLLEIEDELAAGRITEEEAARMEEELLSDAIGPGAQ